MQVALPPEPREELVPKATIPADGVVRSSYAIGQTGERCTAHVTPQLNRSWWPMAPRNFEN
jgi:hypothetical protein